MQGIVSFHPVDFKFFDKIVQPLVAGEKANPEQFLDDGPAGPRRRLGSLRYKLGSRSAVRVAQAPASARRGHRLAEGPRAAGAFRLQARPAGQRVAETVEPDLHLHGRPFLITEGSADRVAALVDEYLSADGEEAVRALVLEQLSASTRRSAGRSSRVEPGHQTADMVYRRELLTRLKVLYDLPHAARQGGHLGPCERRADTGRTALPRELPWRAVFLHSRAVPFWIGRDVDGLDSICRAADVEPPVASAGRGACSPASCEEFPGLRESAGFEMTITRRDVGAFVPPEEIPDLLSFLSAEGSRIIQAATQHGEGPPAPRCCARSASAPGTPRATAWAISRRRVSCPSRKMPEQRRVRGFVRLTPPLAV